MSKYIEIESCGECPFSKYVWTGNGLDYFCHNPRNTNDSFHIGLNEESNKISKSCELGDVTDFVPMAGA